MRVLALDIGHKRCGIAISDPAGKVATPLCVLPTREVQDNAPSFRRVCEDWEPELLVVGLPLSLSGQDGQQAQYTQQMARSIAVRLRIPLQYADERLSSSQAKRILREKGLSEKEMRGKIDMIAASVFLQSWLDAYNSETRVKENGQ